ncbi:MAG: HAD-IA family hydrolase [Defluviitaleaceae bacterium]|nr:HAD-IA family hydrolase [Defluviitaleaceae bacterium]
MKYDLCLFDLDGTLTDPQVGMEKSVRYALDALGVKTEMKNFNAFIGPPLRDNFRDFFGFTGELNELAVTKYREYFGEKGLFENEVYPGIIELLKQLKERGIKTAIATSKVTEYAERIAERFEFSMYFDYICGSEFNGERSAKREIISHILQEIKTPAERVVMIGDRKHDIIGANDTGIDSVGITWGFGNVDELKEAGATYIINLPEELIQIIECPTHMH